MNRSKHLCNSGEELAYGYHLHKITEERSTGGLLDLLQRQIKLFSCRSAQTNFSVTKKFLGAQRTKRSLLAFASVAISCTREL